ncbi:hypothetical protein BaRGS_00025473 [Batillaria attramentaria]|uniref:Uncharacterized protein n=1 Tax=Batillaria attramentaria TaxID=370345 RepID=A0ABD0K8B8_9CAEN
MRTVNATDIRYDTRDLSHLVKTSEQSEMSGSSLRWHITYQTYPPTKFNDIVCSGKENAHGWNSTLWCRFGRRKPSLKILHSCTPYRATHLTPSNPVGRVGDWPTGETTRGRSMTHLTDTRKATCTCLPCSSLPHQGSQINSFNPFLPANDTDRAIHQGKKSACPQVISPIRGATSEETGHNGTRLCSQRHHLKLHLKKQQPPSLTKGRREDSTAHNLPQQILTDPPRTFCRGLEPLSHRARPTSPSSLSPIHVEETFAVFAPSGRHA